MLNDAESASFKAGRNPAEPWEPVMRKIPLILLGALLAAFAVGAPLPYDESADAKAAVQQALAAAKQSRTPAFVIFGAASLLMGLTLFMLRDHASAPEDTSDKKGHFKANLEAYRLCLKNRNIVFTSLVLMVGAAGRGTGINITYLVP